jgi:hypothetical protein
LVDSKFTDWGTNTELLPGAGWPTASLCSLAAEFLVCLSEVDGAVFIFWFKVADFKSKNARLEFYFKSSFISK